MQFALPDRYNLNVEEVGSGFPLIVLHGGPGLDHSMFRPYLDPLGDEYRLLYIDERGQGRSQRVDPATLSLEVFARDVDLLAESLELDSFALLGHSFGAIIATYHATELGTAAAYVISGGGDSSAALDADVAASLEALGNDGKAIAQSWEDEKSVETDAQLMQLLRDQLTGDIDIRSPVEFDPDDSHADGRRGPHPPYTRCTVDRRLDRKRDERLHFLGRHTVAFGQNRDRRRRQVGKHVDRHVASGPQAGSEQEHRQPDHQPVVINRPLNESLHKTTAMSKHDTHIPGASVPRCVVSRQ